MDQRRKQGRAGGTPEQRKNHYSKLIRPLTPFIGAAARGCVKTHFSTTQKMSRGLVKMRHTSNVREVFPSRRLFTQPRARLCKNSFFDHPRCLAASSKCVIRQMCEKFFRVADFLHSLTLKADLGPGRPGSPRRPSSSPGIVHGGTLTGSN